MTRNECRIQSRDGNSYHRIPLLVLNDRIEKGRAEWIGTDYDEETDTYVHYADRIDD